MSYTIRLSVHDVVDTLLRQGSIDTRIFSSSTMQEGSRLHSVFQKEQDENYDAEVKLTTSFTFDNITFIVEGRADGIILSENSITIDEIKTTVEDLDKFYEDNKNWHLGQAKFYAYIYATDHAIQDIKIRLTYISQNNFKTRKYVVFNYKIDELKTFVFNLMNEYYEYLIFFLAQKSEKKNRFAALNFPYPDYRLGQKEMIEKLYLAANEHEFAYIEAPTGTGKTASALYPYIKMLGKEGEKIFYLTSKNSIKMVALDTLRHFNDCGAMIKAIAISSKDAMCINEKKRHCNPDDCPYARNYYDKIKNVVKEAFSKYNILSSSDLLFLGKKHQICPFEFQLDLSIYFDVIIADYNHLFSPTAHLSRFFDQGNKPYYLLIDECHNLPSRVRDIYSGTLDYFDFKKVHKELTRHIKGTLKLRKAIKNILDYFDELNNGELEVVQNTVPLESISTYFISFLTRFDDECRALLKNDPDLVFDELLELYYNVHNFLELPTDDDSYAYYCSLYNGKIVKINSYCLDSRQYISKAKRIFLSGAMFSATLTPKDFYFDLLGVEENSKVLFLPSPFPKENFGVLVNTVISTFYKDRNNTIVYLLDAILSFIDARIGNYFIFFPSYQYMRTFLELFPKNERYDIFVQESHMNEKERNEFLSHFSLNPSKITLGFVVMGGSFSEGIDLVDDRLIGAIIVGVGLPMVCYENDMLKEYYNNDARGYDYAYTYPGINKVLQAAGRVIRSENDRGMLLLIDTRYQNEFYREIIHSKYPQAKLVFSSNDIIRCAKNFYSEDNK
ncbi:MAG TPA: hypothetical protein DCY93_02365 [Firmicutes bacterium]|nr:hypothetical protein [Bacillota bacterium]